MAQTDIGDIFKLVGLLNIMHGRECLVVFLSLKDETLLDLPYPVVEVLVVLPVPLKGFYVLLDLPVEVTLDL